VAYLSDCGLFFKTFIIEFCVPFSSVTLSTLGNMRNKYKILFGEPEAKTLLWRSRRRWEGTLEVGLKLIGFEIVD